ncbi:hypothetical protein LSCM1_02160 [Leishmania martiniquensis]|uniref:EF-hand domain-containing protein n=1 Tax=Leishmania martiniquensis TaxID=1580590 RepID=A0A836K9F2_9TRYP|nr:hypothetical protein LSCM1_02160 [Leishmania martiniquensis]
MDTLGSPPTVSGSASPQASILNASTTTSTVASPAPLRLHRSVKFDPTIDSGAGGLGHSNELSLDTSFANVAGCVANTRERRGEPSGGDEAIPIRPPYPKESSHGEEEVLQPFQLTREDVVAAFEFLDVSGSGLLTMGNLKHRLSAFFPQLTSKEYKFLIEDPSGSTGVGMAASSAARATSVSRHGGAADGCNSNAGGPKSSSVTPAASSARPENSCLGGSDAIAIEGGLCGEGGLVGGAGPYSTGARAGLDVDQLWELIDTFQQLQRTLGTAQTDRAEGNSFLRSRTTSSAAFNAGFDAYLVDAHEGAGGRGGECGFDAVGEAFRVYDPRNSHYVEEDLLSCIMARVGFGELSEEELAVLVSTADFDGDGRISLQDFRRLVNMKGRFKK